MSDPILSGSDGAAPAIQRSGMSRVTAWRLEMFIIGLGLFALVLIFQPFSITLFAIGSGLVVLAGLINNILPLAQPGVRARSVITVALIVAMIFCIVLLLSIAAAHAYGVFFLTPPEGAAPSLVPNIPFYAQPFVWGVAATTAVLAGVIWLLTVTDRGST
jgi:hypothetical protein